MTYIFFGALRLITASFLYCHDAFIPNLHGQVCAGMLGPRGRLEVQCQFGQNGEHVVSNIGSEITDAGAIGDGQ